MNCLNSRSSPITSQTMSNSAGGSIFPASDMTATKNGWFMFARGATCLEVGAGTGVITSGFGWNGAKFFEFEGAETDVRHKHR